MRLTVIPTDGAVYVDSFSYSGLPITAPDTVHALQWDTDTGWVEFTVSKDGTKPQNEVITELPAWAIAAVAQWQSAKDADDAAQALAKLQPVTTGSQTL